MYQGVAYVAQGNSVVAVDLASGMTLATEDFSGGQVLDLGIDQGNLYVLTSEGVPSHTVSKVVLDGADLPEPAATLVITGHPASGVMHLFAANGYIYVGGSDNNLDQETPGIEVIKDNGTSLSLVGPPSGITGFAAATNGSGLALYTGANSGSQPGAQVGLLDVSDPTNTAKVITIFNTPGVAEGVAMADGLGFIALGPAGLAVLNYLPLDTKGVAPKASINLPSSVILGTSGSKLEVAEGSVIPVLASVSDDVQVHNVELLVNGVVVENAVSAPFNLTAVLPSLAQNGSAPLTIQVEAIDTGGNAGLSNPLSIELVKNPTPFTLVFSNLPDAATVTTSFRSVVLRFSHPVLESTVVPANLRIIAADHTAIAPAGIEFRDLDHTVVLSLPALADGTYQFEIAAPSITDGGGKVLGSSNVTTGFTVSSFSDTWINPNGGNWSDPSNWSSGSVPGSLNNVVIDVPGNVVIDYDQGDTSIASLICDDQLTLTGGSLAVTGTVGVNNTFTLDGGTLIGADILAGSGGQALIFTSNGGTLDGVTTSCNLDLATLFDASGTVIGGLAQRAQRSSWAMRRARPTVISPSAATRRWVARARWFSARTASTRCPATRRL